MRVLKNDWRFITGCAVAFFMAVVSCVHAQSITESNLAEISFDQKLNTQVNLDLRFRDEQGREVQLENYFGKKPVILVLGYYQCPMLCTLTLNGLVHAMDDMKWSVGREFDIINVSIDPRDTPALALAKKKNYIRQYGRAGAEAGWHFLTGNESAIRQLADEAGFHYAYDTTSKQYAHPSGLVILTPEGKISHYVFGVTYDVNDIFGALRDASGNRIGSPVQRLILLCFHYNPIRGKYGATIMLAIRVIAVLTMVGLAWGIMHLLRKEKFRPAGAIENAETTTLGKSSGPRV